MWILIRQLEGVARQTPSVHSCYFERLASLKTERFSREHLLEIVMPPSLSLSALGQVRDLFIQEKFSVFDLISVADVCCLLKSFPNYGKSPSLLQLQVS